MLPGGQWRTACGGLTHRGNSGGAANAEAAIRGFRDISHAGDGGDHLRHTGLERALPVRTLFFSEARTVVRLR